MGPTGKPLTDFPVPAPLPSHGPARVIAMVNQKGGVGKTTSTINLAAALAEYGRKVLLVDFDPQGALSAGFGTNPHEMDITVYNVLMDRKVKITDAIVKTDVENIDLLPANIDLSAAEVQLVNEVAREQVLERALRNVIDDYDVVLIDCQPSLGLLTINALTAAHGVIIPLTAEFFALRAVALLMETIDKVKDRLNQVLELDGVVATMYDARTCTAARSSPDWMRPSATSSSRRSSSAPSNSLMRMWLPSRLRPTQQTIQAPRLTATWPAN